MLAIRGSTGGSYSAACGNSTVLRGKPLTQRMTLYDVFPCVLKRVPACVGFCSARVISRLRRSPRNSTKCQTEFKRIGSGKPHRRRRMTPRSGATTRTKSERSDQTITHRNSEACRRHFQRKFRFGNPPWWNKDVFWLVQNRTGFRLGVFSGIGVECLGYLYII